MALVNDLYRQGDVVINITGHDFGGLLKMGDMIATLNVLEYMRIHNENPNIKFYIPDTALQTEKDYVREFRDFVAKISDYISYTPGQFNFEGFVEIWSFREQHGDLVKIKQALLVTKTICFFPLIDATYNTERNFSKELIQDIINEYSSPIYNKHEKFICIKGELPEGIDTKDFIISNSFKQNLYYAATCEYYIGGDTGLSHLAGITNNPNRNLRLYYSYGYHGGWASSFTAPFHYQKDNVTMVYFNEKLRAHYNRADLTILENLVLYKPVNPKFRIGVQKDCGYVVVNGYEYDLLLSGGVGSDISFEHEFMNLHPNVNCILVDGTVDAPELPANTTFVKKNIAKHNDNYHTNLVDYIKDYNNVFLKIDVEGGEWDLFNSEFVQHLHKVKQIALEIHNVFYQPAVSIPALKALAKTHHVVHVHENNYCRDFLNIGGNNYPQTFELTLLRKDCRMVGLNDEHLPLEGIDFPNTDHYPSSDINFYPFNIKTN